MKKVRLFSSNLFVAAVFFCIVYGIPYYVIKGTVDPQLPLELKVAILVALAGILITLATVVLEQRKTL